MMCNPNHTLRRSFVSGQKLARRVLELLARSESCSQRAISRLPLSGREATSQRYKARPSGSALASEEYHHVRNGTYAWEECEGVRLAEQDGAS